MYISQRSTPKLHTSAACSDPGQHAALRCSCSAGMSRPSKSSCCHQEETGRQRRLTLVSLPCMTSSGGMCVTCSGTACSVAADFFRKSTQGQWPAGHEQLTFP